MLAFEAMRSDRRVAIDIAALNAGVDAYAHCGRMPEAEACLHETTQRCQQRGIPPAAWLATPRLTCSPSAGVYTSVALNCTRCSDGIGMPVRSVRSVTECRFTVRANKVGSPPPHEDKINNARCLVHISLSCVHFSEAEL